MLTRSLSPLPFCSRLTKSQLAIFPHLSRQTQGGRFFALVLLFLDLYFGRFLPDNPFLRFLFFFSLSVYMRSFGDVSFFYVLVPSSLARQ